MVLIALAMSGFYKAFGLELGYTDSFLSNVGSFTGIANCTGRLGFGYLVDRISYK